MTEQESISALCFSLARDSQINSVLAPQGGSMITASFTLYQEILKDIVCFFSMEGLRVEEVEPDELLFSIP